MILRILLFMVILSFVLALQELYSAWRFEP